MAIITNVIEYWHDGVLLEALYAYDDANNKPRPAVMINHTWIGRDQFVAGKAQKIAELGYLGFAVDMYGKGVLGSSPDVNAGLMKPLMNDRQKLQQRMLTALKTVQQLPQVDTSRCAAIGFCFGGLCVLDLARTGADLKGVVSFHGLLGIPVNTTGNIIKAKVLALHGYNDPMAPPEQIKTFAEEMTRANADWQLHCYGNTMHAFTNPAANNPMLGTVYQPDADKRSWQAMKCFLAEIFV